MRTNLEFLKEMMGPPNMASKTKMELSLHELNMIHRALVKAHQQAQRSHDAVYQALRESQQAAIETYAALSGFESELLFFQEKSGLTEMQKFKLHTIPGDDEENEEHA